MRPSAASAVSPSYSSCDSASAALSSASCGSSVAGSPPSDRVRLVPASRGAAPGDDESRSDPQEATASIASATAQREKAVNVFAERMDAKPGGILTEAGKSREYPGRCGIGARRVDSEFKYRAFISYSHSDERWAKWLHKSLETYSVPKHLVGRETAYGPVPARLAPVFRDRDELATATNLGETLTRALQQSAFQIVICSPAAAKSRWVNEEILAFKRLGREHRIFCLIVAGEPGASSSEATADQECFPNALIYQMGSDGQLTSTRSEPIAADARPNKDSKQDVRLKLVAGMLGVGLDELKQREAHRRHRRMMMLVTASIVGMTITSGLAAAAWLARNQAERERVRAEMEAETARQTTNFLVGLFAVSDPNEARGNSITAREILDKGSQRIESELAAQPAIQATLMETMGAVYTSLALIRRPRRCSTARCGSGSQLYGADSLEVAQSAEKLGGVLTLTAEYDRAEKMYRRRSTCGRNASDPSTWTLRAASSSSPTCSRARASTRPPNLCSGTRSPCSASCSAAARSRWRRACRAWR